MSKSPASGHDPALIRPLEPLLDERAYAHFTGRSVASVRRDRLLGKGCPFAKLGALVRYRPEDIRIHIERNIRGGQDSAQQGGTR